MWEIRSTGSPTNGGGFDPSVTSPGSDYSQQDSPQVAFADLVIGATTTQLTSAANPFTSAHVGNTIAITGGTGFTVGWYNIRSVAGTTATMDRAVGTAASTGGAGKLGGALDSPGSVMAAGALSSNKVWIKAGTYTQSSTSNVAGGRVTTANSMAWEGYATTRGDLGTRPVLRAGAAAMTLVTLADNATITNVEFQANGFATVVGVGQTSIGIGTVAGCKFNAVASGIVETGTLYAEDCEFAGCTTYGINGGGARSLAVYGCTFSTCAIGLLANAHGHIAHCLFVGCTTCGIQVSTATPTIRYCTFVGNATGISSAGTNARVIACHAQGSTAYGFNGAMRLWGCSGYGNGSGHTLGLLANTGFLTPTADPLTNAAGLDFSLNTTAGGGALLRGIARTFPGLAGTSYPDVGAYQSQAAGGVPRIGSPTLRGR